MTKKNGCLSFTLYLPKYQGIHGHKLVIRLLGQNVVPAKGGDEWEMMIWNSKADTGMCPRLPHCANEKHCDLSLHTRHDKL